MDASREDDAGAKRAAKRKSRSDSVDEGVGRDFLHSFALAQTVSRFQVSSVHFFSLTHEGYTITDTSSTPLMINCELDNTQMGA